MGDQVSIVLLIISGVRPIGRANHAITLVGDIIFIFGGIRENKRLRDLWSLDLLTKSFALIDTKQDFIPVYMLIKR